MAEFTMERQSTVAQEVAGAYISGDAIGTTITLTGLGRGGGIIDGVRLLDAGQSGAIDVVFYNALPTATTDNAAFSVAAGDRDKVIGIAHIVAGDYVALGTGNGMAQVSPACPIQFSQTLDGNLYVKLISRDTKTYTNGDLIFRAGRTF